MKSDADQKLLDSLANGDISRKKKEELEFVKLCAKNPKTEEDYRLILWYVVWGSDVNVVDSEGKSPLYYAAEYKDETLIGLLLQGNNFNLARINNKEHEFALHFVLKKDSKLAYPDEIITSIVNTTGYIDVVGIDLDYINRNLSKLDQKLVDSFISKLSVGIKDKYKDVLAAIEAQKTFTGKSLAQTNFDVDTPLIIAVRNKDTAMVVAILSAAKEAGNIKEVVRAKNKYGNTPLIIAAVHSNTAMVVAILSAAKEAGNLKEVLEQKNSYDYTTPLMLVASNGNADAVKAILSAAKEAENLKEVLEQKDRDGYTPLMCAASNGKIDAVKAILSAAKEAGNLKEVLEQKDRDGYTPLMRAARNGKIDAVKAILSAAKEAGNLKEVLEQKNKHGHTPLVFAVAHSNTDAVKEILSAAKEARNLKEVLEAKGMAGRTAFDHSSSEAITKLLKQAGDINKLENLAVKLVKTHKASGIQALHSSVNKYESKSAIGKFFYELLGNYGLKGDVKTSLSKEVAESYLDYKNKTRSSHKEIAEELKKGFDGMIKNELGDKGKTTIVQAQNIRESLFEKALEKFNTDKDSKIDKKDINPDVIAKIDRKILEVFKGKNKDHNIELVSKMIVKELRSLDKTRFAEQALRKEVTPTQPAR